MRNSKSGCQVIWMFDTQLCAFTHQTSLSILQGPFIWMGASPFRMTRCETLSHGRVLDPFIWTGATRAPSYDQARGLFIWTNAGLCHSLWSGTRSISVVRRKALFYGQARGSSVCFGARPSCVVRARLFSVIRRQDAILCGQLWGPNMWLDAGLFFVVSRKALLNVQARDLSLWSGAGPPCAFWPALFIAVEPLIMCTTSHKTLCTTRDQVPQEPIWTKFYKGPRTYRVCSS